MAKLTITSVVDEIEEWQSKYGDFMYSVVAFAGRELVKATKKDRDKALEIQGIFRENLDQPLDMVVEHAGTSKNGNAKWKFIEFGGGTVSSEAEGPNGAAPALGSTHSRSTDSSIRAAVALKAASHHPKFQTPEAIMGLAEIYERWLGESDVRAASAPPEEAPYVGPHVLEGSGDGEAPGPSDAKENA